MLDGTSWPPLDRLNLRDEDRLVAHVLNEPFPLLMKPLPREPEAQAFTLQGIQALRAAAADALDVVLERVIQDRNDCAAVAVAETLFEALRIDPPSDWLAWREAHTACIAMPRAKRRRLGLGRPCTGE
jgi:hypothetical protein